MNHTGFRHGSFQGGSSSDEDLVEVAGEMLDFSMADDVPPLDREMAEGNLSQLAMLVLATPGARRLPWLGQGPVAVWRGGETGRWGNLCGPH